MEKLEERLMTNDAARELSVSPSTVVLWHRIGLLPAERTRNGCRLFKLSDVRELKAQREARRSNQTDSAVMTA